MPRISIRSTRKPRRDRFLYILSCFSSFLLVWFCLVIFFTFNFVGWILSRFIIDFCLRRCCRCFWSCLLLLEFRASACSFNHQFLRLPRLCLAVCFLCTRISTHFSVVNSVLIVFAEDIRLLLNFYIKVRTKALSLVIKISKKKCWRLFHSAPVLFVLQTEI